jgi:hypothetical protein
VLTNLSPVAAGTVRGATFLMEPPDVMGEFTLVYGNNSTQRWIVPTDGTGVSVNGLPFKAPGTSFDAVSLNDCSLMAEDRMTAQVGTL